MISGILPDSWRWAVLDEVKHPDRRSIVSGPFGSNIGSRFFVPSGIPVIRGGNLTTDLSRFVDDGFVYLTEDKAEEFRYCEAIPGDLIFTAAGSLGQVGLVPADCKYPKYIISNKQMRARLDTSKVDVLYAFYWLSSPWMVEYIQQRNTGSSVPLINLSVLRALPLPLPPLAEQRAIARILGALDDKIELNRSTNATLEAMACALFQSWFVDFDPVHAKAVGQEPHGMNAATAALFPDGFEVVDGREVPRGWRVAQLGDIADVVDCLHSKKPERKPHGKPLLQLGNIRDDGLLDMSEVYWISDADYANWTSRIEASSGDCVITNVGRVAATAQVPPGLRAALGRNMTAIRCKPTFPFPTFLIECLLSSAMKEEIARKTDTGTILDALNVRNIPKLGFVLPHYPSVARFEELTRPLRSRMEHNLAVRLSLAALRDALLPKLLSGELRVPEAMRAVEEVA